MKKRMSNRKFLGIVVPVSTLLVAVAVASGVLSNVFSDVLDTYVATGKQEVHKLPGSENWDTSYYSLGELSKENVAAQAKDTTKRIAEEGITLLKNKDQALPLSGKKVSLFGRRSVDTIFGGTGSGSGDASQCTTLIDALKQAGFEVNPTLAKMYQDNLKNVPVADNSMDNPAKQTFYIGEFPQDYYTSEVQSSFAGYSDAAIVVLGRQGGEGMDFATDLKHTESSVMDYSLKESSQYQDGQHSLELTKEEKDMIALAEKNFRKVVVVINSANVLEIDALKNDEKISSILWMSYPGSTGTVALAEILNGTVTPSGHTVDTWPADLTADPSFVNAKARKLSNVNSQNALGDSYRMEYEEGIYVGYRYYETRYAVDNQFKVEGETVGYDKAVSYPFGYGMSYASFDQKFVSHVVKDGKITMEVSVKNTSEKYSGKDVIQVYYHAPYSEGGVEKSDVVLGAFLKTDLLKPSEEKRYTLSFDVEDMASYDTKVHKSYVLDAGNYVLSLRKNAHETFEGQVFTYEVPTAVVYGADNPRNKEIAAQTGDAVNLSEEAKKKKKVQAATNRFDWMTDYFVDYTEKKGGKAVNFTRSNFKDSFPSEPTEKDLLASDVEIQALGAYHPNYYDASDVMPKTGDETSHATIGALRGLTYDDPKWDEVLNRMTVTEMENLIESGNQGTSNVKSISLPATKASDGPAGLKQFGGVGLGAKGNFNCSSTLTAATFNVKLAEEYGVSVGQECLLSSPAITGWYAPGCNTHRSAFGGRNFEYYSEDPLLSGKMCAGTVQGSASKGVECYMKHFALNDMESHRTSNGQMVYCNEQALREIYLKPFEIAITEPVGEVKYLEYTKDAHGTTNGAKTATKTIRVSNSVMTSFSRFGASWSGNTPALLKDVLRGEWGFLGCVVTDYNGSAFMTADGGIASGNDLMLANKATLLSKIIDKKNPSTVKNMRTACKNIIYDHVYSNAFNGISEGDVVTYRTSPWKYGVLAIEIVNGLAAAGLITWAVIRCRKSKKAEEVAGK